VAHIQILCDSGCDLPLSERTRLGIGLVSLSIRFGAEEFTDRVDLSPEEFWERCAGAATLPEMAAPSPGAFLAAYEAAAAAGATGIIVVTISAALSATYESARVAAEGFDAIPVHIVDTRAVSMAEGLIAIDLAEAAAAGADFDALVARATSLVPKVGVGAMLVTLEHLIKGGRIGGAKALLGQVLSIKPLLKLENGVVTEAGRQRTTAKALRALVDMVQAAAPLSRLAIMHANSPDLETMKELLSAVPVAHPIVVADIGPTVGTHGGPGLIALAWLEADR